MTRLYIMFKEIPNSRNRTICNYRTHQEVSTTTTGPLFPKPVCQRIRVSLFWSERINSICLSHSQPVWQSSDLSEGTIYCWRVCWDAHGGFASCWMDHTSQMLPLDSLVARLVVFVLLRYARSSGRCTGAQSCARSAPAKGNPAHCCFNQKHSPQTPLVGKGKTK